MFRELILSSFYWTVLFFCNKSCILPYFFAFSFSKSLIYSLNSSFLYFNRLIVVSSSYIFYSLRQFLYNIYSISPIFLSFCYNILFNLSNSSLKTNTSLLLLFVSNYLHSSFFLISKTLFFSNSLTKTLIFTSYSLF